MKRIRILVAAAFTLLFAGAAAQAAIDAYTTGNVNLRTGPSARYGRIATIPAHSGVVIFRCTRSWCDIGWAGYRGWVSARYLDRGRQYRVRRHYAPRYYEPYVLGPVIGFGFGTFWPHYHDHYHYRPPVIHRHAPAPRPHAGRHGHGRNWHHHGGHRRHHRR